MKPLYFVRVSLGCDPEFFFSKKGEVVGAEKIIPPEGIEYIPYRYNIDKVARNDGSHTALGDDNSRCIIDGVQAELNPRPNTCRANLGNEISQCFRTIYNKIKKDKSLNIDFSQVVEVTEKELLSLSEKARQFGCAPSTNIYDTLHSEITVNPAVYRYRSAGGHIHLGDNSQDAIRKVLDKTDILVPILDIVLGNTCVLIDRNPWNKERRKVYGKAGEFRKPLHGIEYRTLSNFWLQSYQLMSFVMGMARFAVCIVKSGLENEFMSRVKQTDITKAINQNDFDLAYKNFSKVEDIIVQMTEKNDFDYPLSELTIKEFKYFITKDMNYWFKDNPLEHWIHLPEGHGTGWEAFAQRVIKKDMGKCVTIK